MTIEQHRCIECGAALTDGVCGACAPSGRPLDKGSGAFSPALPTMRRSFGISIA